MTTAWNDAATPTLITAARVISRPEDPPVEQGAVLVAGSTVSAVGAARELEALAGGARRLHFPGATIIPGLINLHVHLAFDVTRDPRPALEQGDLASLEGTVAANAKALLDGGVTTARDLGDRDGLVAAFREQVDAGRAVGPTMLTAHSPLTAPGGHCWFLGGELDLNPRRGDAERAVRTAVSRRAAAGADVIKVMASGGNLTPTGAPMWQSQFSDRDLALIVDVAHENALPVAAHAHGTDAMAACARAGVDTIEHGSWLGPPGPDGAMGYAPSEETAEAIARAGIVVVPTRARQWQTWPPEARLDLQLAKLAWDDERGIRLAAGNDAGVGEGYFDPLVDTVTMFRAAGWSPRRALATATTEAAAALGRGDQIGRIAEGYRADLVVLDGDPLEDLESLARVQQVIVGGRRHAPRRAAGRAQNSALPGRRETAPRAAEEGGAPTVAPGRPGTSAKEPPH